MMQCSQQHDAVSRSPLSTNIAIPQSYHNPPEESEAMGGGGGSPYSQAPPQLESASAVGYNAQFSDNPPFVMSRPPTYPLSQDDVEESNFSPQENFGYDREAVQSSGSSVYHNHPHPTLRRQAQLYHGRDSYSPDRQLVRGEEYRQQQGGNSNYLRESWSPLVSSARPNYHQTHPSVSTNAQILSRLAVPMRYGSLDSLSSSSRSSGLASCLPSPTLLQAERAPSVHGSQTPSPSPDPVTKDSPESGAVVLPSYYPPDEDPVGTWIRYHTRIPPDLPLSLWSVPDPDPGCKPALPLKWLMALAIYESPEKKLSLSEILTAMKDRFAIFGVQESWKESARHTLSLWKLFKNEPRPKTEPGKGGRWMVVRATSPKRKRKRGSQKARSQSESPEAADTTPFANEFQAGPSSRVIQSKRTPTPGSPYNYPPTFASTSFQEQASPSTLQPYPQLGPSSSQTRNYYPNYAERHFSHSHFPPAAGSQTPDLVSTRPIPSGSRTMPTTSGFHFSTMASTVGPPMEFESFHPLEPQSTLLDDETGGVGDGSNPHEESTSGQRSKGKARAFSS